MFLKLLIYLLFIGNSLVVGFTYASRAFLFEKQRISSNFRNIKVYPIVTLSIQDLLNEMRC
jgi:hypothetical protein